MKQQAIAISTSCQRYNLLSTNAPTISRIYCFLYHCENARVHGPESLPKHQCRATLQKAIEVDYFVDHQIEGTICEELRSDTALFFGDPLRSSKFVS